jgi:hypothetical protein
MGFARDLLEISSKFWSSKLDCHYAFRATTSSVLQECAVPGTTVVVKTLATNPISIHRNNTKALLCINFRVESTRNGKDVALSERQFAKARTSDQNVAGGLFLHFLKVNFTSKELEHNKDEDATL